MRKNRGFTLIEMLVVMTIIGMVAAIAVPSLMNAIDRSRRSSTMADIRTLGTALERYAFDHHRYPVVDDMAALRGELEPDYIKKLPMRDGWSHPFVFEVDTSGSTYTIRSPGKDGELQPESPADVTQDFAVDIVFVDGAFLQPPAGEQV